MKGKNIRRDYMQFLTEQTPKEEFSWLQKLIDKFF